MLYAVLFSRIIDRGDNRDPQGTVHFYTARGKPSNNDYLSPDLITTLFH
jgi:hypothetical protein